MFADLQHVPRAGVRHGNNAGLRRQRLQPVRQTVLRVLPVFRGGFQPLIDHAAILLLRDQLAKCVLTLNGPALAAGGG